MAKPVISERTRQSIRPGDKEHYLTIISDPFYKNGEIHYEVACDCGNKSTVNRSRFGKTKSCGCLVGEREKPLLAIPKELKNTRSKLIKDGKLLVFEDGTIFRVKGNFYFRATEFFTAGRESVGGYDVGYPTITYSENNRQIHKTVHRLVGKAFLKKGKDANEINHKDGDKRNNHISNLEWVTRQENVDHAYSNNLIRTLENTPHRCIKCSGPSMRSGTVCSECKSGIKQLKKSLISKQIQRDRYRDINTETLKPIYKRIIRSRFQGMTLAGIGQELGFTREYIRQLEEKVLNSDADVFTTKELNKKPLKIDAVPKIGDYKISLKAARINAHMTLDEVSKIVEKSITTVRNWECGKTKIPKKYFKSLVSLYKVPINILKYERNGNWIVLKEAPND